MPDYREILAKFFKKIFDFLGIDLILGANIIMIILVISYKNKIKRWGTLSNLEKFSIFTTIVGFVIITLINILRLLNIINFKNRS